jgi:hypothetical protein
MTLHFHLMQNQRLMEVRNLVPVLNWGVEPKSELMFVMPPPKRLIGRAGKSYQHRSGLYLLQNSTLTCKRRKGQSTLFAFRATDSTTPYPASPLRALWPLQLYNLPVRWAPRAQKTPSASWACTQKSSVKTLWGSPLLVHTAPGRAGLVIKCSNVAWVWIGSIYMDGHHHPSNSCYLVLLSSVHWPPDASTPSFIVPSFPCFFQQAKIYNPIFKCTTEAHH